MQDDWIIQYIDLMFGPDHDYETMTQAAKLKFEHMPTQLFKYRSLNSQHTWEALESDTLYVDKTSNQNDKREANIILTRDAEISVQQVVYGNVLKSYGLPLPSTPLSGTEEFMKYVTELFRKRSMINDGPNLIGTSNYQTLKQSLDRAFDVFMDDIRKSVRQMYSICCFSAVNDDDLMWAHYADSTKGCCIEYPFKALGSAHPDVACMFPAIYVEDNRVYMNRYDPEKGADGSVCMFAATLKTSQWAYEKEWRRLYLATDGGKTQSMPEPSAIYMGQDISPEHKKKILELCERRRIKAYQMKYDQSSDRIIFI